MRLDMIGQRARNRSSRPVLFYPRLPTFQQRQESKMDGAP